MTTDTTPNHEAPIPASTSAPVPATVPETTPQTVIRPETTEAEDETAARVTRLRRVILDRARVAGVERIEARYCGGYDSGAIEELSFIAERAPEMAETLLVPVMTPRFDTATRGWIEVEQLVSLRSAVQRLLEDLLTGCVGNWWDGEIETEGEITWHIAEDRIEGSHDTYVRQAEHESYTL